MAKDNDDIPTLTLEVLKDIRGDMREMKTDIRELKIDMRDMKADMHDMKADMHEMRSDIRELTGRFDHFLEFGGEANRALDRRVTALESRVFGAGSETPR